VNDLFLEGEWVYAYDRTPIKIQPQWVNGATNTLHDEDCVEISSSNKGQWRDIRCNIRLYYICEYDTE
jgi:hypothetical protein